ncbi:hypothetical protein RchiOBHm_Chr1g0320471 [Rosa chinensis]|uniref:Uncharacterized protein n=1 Tax=Rosa chinensis TaxID=74649 RepID=A0A2P6S8R2_ROSCH|nr:hypothetical protein RchiOBHm_Chr1g0320471 [Rosa chinensis]
MSLSKTRRGCCFSFKTATVERATPTGDQVANNREYRGASIF